jgi:hypothetical protein
MCVVLNFLLSFFLIQDMVENIFFMPFFFSKILNFWNKLRIKLKLEDIAFQSIIALIFNFIDVISSQRIPPISIIFHYEEQKYQKKSVFCLIYDLFFYFIKKRIVIFIIHFIESLLIYFLHPTNEKYHKFNSVEGMSFLNNLLIFFFSNCKNTISILWLNFQTHIYNFIFVLGEFYFFGFRQTLIIRIFALKIDIGNLTNEFVNHSVFIVKFQKYLKTNKLISCFFLMNKMNENKIKKIRSYFFLIFMLSFFFSISFILFNAWLVIKIVNPFLIIASKVLLAGLFTNIFLNPSIVDDWPYSWFTFPPSLPMFGHHPVFFRAMSTITGAGSPKISYRLNHAFWNHPHVIASTNSEFAHCFPSVAENITFQTIHRHAVQDLLLEKDESFLTIYNFTHSPQVTGKKSIFFGNLLSIYEQTVSEPERSVFFAPFRTIISKSLYEKTGKLIQDIKLTNVGKSENFIKETTDFVNTDTFQKEIKGTFVVTEKNLRTGESFLELSETKSYVTATGLILPIGAIIKDPKKGFCLNEVDFDITSYSLPDSNNEVYPIFWEKYSKNTLGLPLPFPLQKNIDKIIAERYNMSPYTHDPFFIKPVITAIDAIQDPTISEEKKQQLIGWVSKIENKDLPVGIFTLENFKVLHNIRERASILNTVLPTTSIEILHALKNSKKDNLSKSLSSNLNNLNSSNNSGNSNPFDF